MSVTAVNPIHSSLTITDDRERSYTVTYEVVTDDRGEERLARGPDEQRHADRSGERRQRVQERARLVGVLGEIGRAHV